MPQLSLYIDETTLHKLENAAKIEHLSVSRYAVKKLNELLNAAWPEHYEELFGAISDDTFAPSKIGLSIRIPPHRKRWARRV